MTCQLPAYMTLNKLMLSSKDFSLFNKLAPAWLNSEFSGHRSLMIRRSLTTIFKVGPHKCAVIIINTYCNSSALFSRSQSSQSSRKDEWRSRLRGCLMKSFHGQGFQSFCITIYRRLTPRLALNNSSIWIGFISKLILRAFFIAAVFCADRRFYQITNYKLRSVSCDRAKYACSDIKVKGFSQKISLLKDTVIII